MKDIGIIGAGYAGLTSALILADSGFKITLYEAHDKPGGLAQAFTRKIPKKSGLPLEYDAELTEAITGFNEDGCFYKLYSDLGVKMNKIGPMHIPKYFGLLDVKNGISIPTPNTMEEHRNILIEHFPYEILGINSYFEYLDKIKSERTVDTRDCPERDIKEHMRSNWVTPSFLTEILATARTQPTLTKNFWRTHKNKLNQFTKNQDLQAALSTFFGYIGEKPSKVSSNFYDIMMSLYQTEGGAQAPKYGSFQIIPDTLVERLEELNVDVRFKTKLEEINVEKGKVKSINLKNRNRGKEDYNAEHDSIILACDPSFHLENIADSLPKSYLKRIRKMQPSISLAGLHTITTEPLHQLQDKLDNASTVLASSVDALENFDEGNLHKHYAIYVGCPTISRPKANLIRIDGEPTSDYHIVSILTMAKSDGFMIELRKHHRNLYRKHKEKLGNQLLKIFDDHFGTNILKNHEYKEISTASTVSRYAGSQFGQVYGLAGTVKQFLPFNLQNETPIENLFLGDSHTISGGVAGAIEAGKIVANKLLSSK